MTIEAPAKVNLVLRVLGRRPDGYHDLETLMVPLALHDTLSVEAGGDGIVVTCSDPEIPCDASNLAHKAANAFFRATGWPTGVRIHIEKRIPHGAGLGGGSSDAAAVLLALNELTGADLPVERLEEIAATFGSDIPFFVRGRAAWARGRGEVLEAAGELPAFPILLVKPPFPVSTAWAYRAWAAAPAAGETRRLPSELTLQNDLEPPVFSKYIVLPALLRWLEEQPEVEAAMMSGSGSTVFAVLRQSETDLAKRVQAEFGETFWTHLTYTRS